MSPTPLLIVFNAPMNVNDTVTLTWLGAGGSTSTATHTFKTLRAASYEATIGTNGPTQAGFYYTALTTDFAANFTVTTIGNQVFVWSKNTDNLVYGSTTNTDNAVSFNPQFNLPVPIGLKCRSPYIYLAPTAAGASSGVYTIGTTGATGTFLYTDANTNQFINQTLPPNTTEYTQCALVGSVLGPSGSTITYNTDCSGSLIDFDSANYIMKEWTGDVYAPPSQISYAKTKQKVINTQGNLYINLSNLAKEGLEGDINNYVLPTGLTASNLGLNETKWFNVVTDFTYIGATVSGKTYNDTFFVLDGYTEPGESQGLINPSFSGSPQRILMSNWFDRTYTQYSKAKIHFVTKDLLSVDSFASGSTVSVPIAFTTNWQDSDKYVQGIDIDTSQEMIYQFNYAAIGGYQVRTHIQDYDCQYRNYIVMFKNKWGVIESLCFNKKSTRSLTTEDSSYLRSIVDYNGSFNVSRHTNKVFNTSGYEDWTLNTDWLPDYMNVPLQELMLSEEIWLFDGYTPVPVNKADMSITYKTSVNDGLIQYTMKFKLSHNTINNIL